jgi:cell division protein DivIC
MDKILEQEKKAFPNPKKWFTIIGAKNNRSFFTGGAAPKTPGNTPLAGKGRHSMKIKLRRASIFTKIVIVALLLYAGVTLVQLNQRIGQAKTEQAALQQEVDDYVRENAELSYKIEHSEDEDIIEDIARNELGLVEPGEKIFIDVSN